MADPQLEHRSKALLAKTLTENNVESGTKLTLKQAKEPVLGLTDQNPDYQARTFGVPGTDAVELMLGNVIDSSGPARFNKGGRPQNWSTMDRERDKMLAPENQLTANEVKTRPQLAVVQKHSDLILKIISRRGKHVKPKSRRHYKHKFLNDLILSFRLAKETRMGHSFSGFFAATTTASPWTWERLLAKTAWLTATSL